MPLAELALRAGKAVLCEKPMGMSLAEAEHLAQVQRETGSFLQIGFELHYSTMYQQIKQWIDAGTIGEVVTFNPVISAVNSIGRTPGEARVQAFS